jgi:hypothetical protein
LGEVGELQQVLVRLGLFERSQILALNVLNQGQLIGDIGRDVAHDHGDSTQTGSARCPPSALAGDQDILVRAGLANDDRLNESVFPNRCGELLDGGLVEDRAGLIRRGLDLVERKFERAGGRLTGGRRGSCVGYEGREAAAENRAARESGHLSAPRGPWRSIRVRASSR